MPFTHLPFRPTLHAQVGAGRSGCDLGRPGDQGHGLLHGRLGIALLMLLTTLTMAPDARANPPSPDALFYQEASDCTAGLKARVVQHLQQPPSEARNQAILTDTEHGFIFIGVAYKKGLRNPEADQMLADKEGVDVLFTPTADEMFPKGFSSSVQEEAVSKPLCGVTRAAHFRGTLTGWLKLINIVQPDKAVFGIKDFQQLAIIKRMVQDLCFPITIIEAPVARAEDGLALSSRNGYLNARERAIAPALYRSLLRVRDAIAAGERDFPLLEARAQVELLEAGMRPDYFSIRAARTLEPVGPGDHELAILAAAWLGRTRLIDNVTACITS